MTLVHEVEVCSALVGHYFSFGSGSYDPGRRMQRRFNWGFSYLMSDEASSISTSGIFAERSSAKVRFPVRFVVGLGARPSFTFILYVSRPDY